MRNLINNIFFYRALHINVPIEMNEEKNVHRNCQLLLSTMIINDN